MVAPPVAVVSPAVTISVTSVMRVYRERIPVNRTCSTISSLLHHRAVATNIVLVMEQRDDGLFIQDALVSESEEGGGIPE